MEYPIYTRMGAGGGVHSGFEPIAAAMADSTPAGIADGYVQRFG